MPARLVQPVPERFKLLRRQAFSRPEWQPVDIPEPPTLGALRDVEQDSDVCGRPGQALTRVRDGHGPCSGSLEGVVLPRELLLRDDPGGELRLCRRLR